jgi:hypothetical protein
MQQHTHNYSGQVQNQLARSRLCTYLINTAVYGKSVACLPLIECEDWIQLGLIAG